MDIYMTDEVAREIYDMQKNPFRTFLAASLTLSVILMCLIGCGALLAAVSKIGILL
jgi:hypothetical protein